MKKKMKKLWAGITSAVLACSTVLSASVGIAVPATAEELPEPVLYGDVNCDGTVTIADRVRLWNYLADYDNVSLTAQGIANADVYADGILDGKDVHVLEMYTYYGVWSLPVTEKDVTLYPISAKLVSGDVETDPGETVTLDYVIDAPKGISKYEVYVRTDPASDIDLTCVGVQEEGFGFSTKAKLSGSFISHELKRGETVEGATEEKILSLTMRVRNSLPSGSYKVMLDLQTTQIWDSDGNAFYYQVFEDDAPSIQVRGYETTTTTTTTEPLCDTTYTTTTTMTTTEPLCDTTYTTTTTMTTTEPLCDTTYTTTTTMTTTDPFCDTTYTTTSDSIPTDPISTDTTPDLTIPVRETYVVTEEYMSIYQSPVRGETYLGKNGALEFLFYGERRTAEYYENTLSYEWCEDVPVVSLWGGILIPEGLYVDGLTSSEGNLTYQESYEVRYDSQYIAFQYEVKDGMPVDEVKLQLDFHTVGGQSPEGFYDVQVVDCGMKLADDIGVYQVEHPEYYYVDSLYIYELHTTPYPTTTATTSTTTRTTPYTDDWASTTQTTETEDWATATTTTDWLASTTATTVTTYDVTVTTRSATTTDDGMDHTTVSYTTTTTTTATLPPFVVVLVGDIDGDGILSLTDVIHLNKNLDSLSTAQRTMADCFQDGILDYKDIRALLMRVAGIVKHLPVQGVEIA